MFKINHIKFDMKNTIGRQVKMKKETMRFSNYSKDALAGSRKQ
jgi:hypothetical protein